MSLRNAMQLDLSQPLPHTLGLLCLSQLYFQICPNRSCPTIVLHLQLFDVVCILFLPFPPSACFYKRIFNWWAVLLCNYLRFVSAVAAENFPFSKFPSLHYWPLVIYNITLIHALNQ